jgi:hypothetical protein
VLTSLGYAVEQAFRFSFRMSPKTNLVTKKGWTPKINVIIRDGTINHPKFDNWIEGFNTFFMQKKNYYYRSAATLTLEAGPPPLINYNHVQLNDEDYSFARTSRSCEAEISSIGELWDVPQTT